MKPNTENSALAQRSTSPNSHAPVPIATLQSFTTRGSLLAMGLSLVMIGLVLRTFARTSRRAAALRQQHRLHDQKLGEAIQGEEVNPTTSWFERHLSTIANTVACAGLTIAILAAFRQ
jgi:hypothetical protein